jgi:hypothetical protein
MSGKPASGVTASPGPARPSIPRLFRRRDRHRVSRPRAASVAAALLFASLLSACLRAAAQQTRNSGVPLAYVRSLVLAPVLLATPPDPPLLPRPPAASKQEAARWAAQAKARSVTEALRSSAVGSLGRALSEQMSEARGVTVTRGDLQVPPDFAVLLATLARQSGTEMIRDDSLSFIYDFARAGALFTAKVQSDSCLFAVMDRFGNNTGLEREVWIRTVAWLWKRVDKYEPGVLVGPFFAVGRAVAGRQLFRRGYSRSDDQLIKVATKQAALRLAGTLQTGRQALFMEDCRVAVIPAGLPASVEKTLEPMKVGARQQITVEARQTRRVPLSSLTRESDVLFQPETSPVARQLDPRDVAHAVRGVGFPVAEVWQAGKPDRERLARIADWLRVQYVFVSRAQSVELSETADVASDAGQLRPATRRQADVQIGGALYGRRENAILWQDTVEGGTIAITEYVRHEPRLRTDEQCVGDATRTAYAHLRAAFEEFKRKFDRDTVTTAGQRSPARS